MKHVGGKGFWVIFLEITSGHCFADERLQTVWFERMLPKLHNKERSHRGTDFMIMSSTLGFRGIGKRWIHREPVCFV